MRKSKFLTVCFGAGFGAGQMYLGLQKKGFAIMGAAAVIVAVAALIHFPVLLVALPVIWCYAFFDSINAYGKSVEERKIDDDQFVSKVYSMIQEKDVKSVVERRHVLIGWGCVAFGVYLLFGEFVGPIASLVDNWFYNSIVWRIYDAVPSMILAIIIIVTGLKLIKRNINLVTDSIAEVSVAEQEESANGIQ